MDLNVTILYASETGTAQDTAEQIWKNAKRFGLKCSVTSMDEYHIENLLSERLLVFVVATTGQGDPPKNMKKFWSFLLRKSLPRTSLSLVKYAVLGLGDSSYEKYNFAAKKLNKRLAQLGAEEIVPIGLADDQHDLGIDATVGPWVRNLWEAVTKTFRVSLDDSLASEDTLIERFNVTVVKDAENLAKISEKKDIYRLELEVNDELRLGTVIENRRTTSENHFQDVRLIKLQAQDVDYDPGDILYIRPRNSQKQVDSFFALLKENDIPLHRETLIKVSEKEIRVPLPLKQTLTLEEIVEQYWDLNFKPRRSTIQVLASISEDQLEKEKLLEFASPGGQEELFNYVNRPRRNVLEVLRDFPHTSRNINERILFEVMSPIKPRAFSIASSKLFSKDEIHLLVAVVNYKSKLVEPRLGLCSNWLASLRLGDQVMFSIQKGTFRFDCEKPMILVGTGTGLAAFRSLMLQRIALDHDLKDTALFFGCRSIDKDFHCQEDFELMKSKSCRTFCAFSRDQEDKIYVQHVIAKESRLCWELLQREGCIYLSGSSKNMPKCVRDEFVRIAAEFGKLNQVEAEEFVAKLEKERRYQTETWD